MKSTTRKAKPGTAAKPVPAAPVVGAPGPAMPVIPAVTRDRSATRSVGTTAQAAPAKVVLVLQGGGALGAYQIGAFEALHAAGFGPDWLAGISIGAFNAAIIAGNEPAERLDKLLGFWHDISWPEFGAAASFLPLQIWHDNFSSGEAVAFGQPNFFSPRPLSPYLLNAATPDALSFYDTNALTDTLPRYASFDRINRKATRLTLGTTNLSSGALEFFDSAVQPLRPAHVIASGSLPPGFPATEIDGVYYWDGGCVSNTPLEAIAAAQGSEALRVFVIDLWDAAGLLPATMNDVLWRIKQIQYAGRAAHDLRMIETAANHLHMQTMAQEAGRPDTLERRKGRLDLVHIKYRPGANHIASSDTDFSRNSLAARRAAGRHDMEHALALAPWTRPLPAHQRARVHPIVPGAASA
jgi:NTE family protein